MKLQRRRLPAGTEELFELLERAFGSEVPAPFYRPLLFILSDQLSMRTLATFVEAALSRDYHEALALISAVKGRKDDETNLDKGALSETRVILRVHGYNEWAKRSSDVV